MLPPEIIDHLRKALQSGESELEIRKEILSYGWPETEVDNSLSEAKKNLVIKKPGHLSLIISAIVVILALSGGLYLFKFNNKQPETPQAENSNSPIQDIPSPITSTPPTNPEEKPTNTPNQTTTQNIEKNIRLTGRDLMVKINGETQYTPPMTIFAEAPGAYKVDFLYELYYGAYYTTGKPVEEIIESDTTPADKFTLKINSCNQSKISSSWPVIAKAYWEDGTIKKDTLNIGKCREEAPIGTIAITLPKNGDSLKAGQTYEIKWDTTGYGSEETVTITAEGYFDGWTIATTKNTGSFFWTIDPNATPQPSLLISVGIGSGTKKEISQVGVKISN